MKEQTKHEYGNANYDFPVSLARVYTKDGQEVPSARAVIREDEDNRPIASVKSGYQLFQHTDVMKAADKFRNAFGEVDIYNSIDRDGARFMSTFTYKDQTMKVGLNDFVGFRVHVLNTYDGSTSAQLRVAGLVLACLNGMTTSRGAHDIRIRHTKKEVDWLNAFPEPEEVFEDFKIESAMWQELSKLDMTEKDLNDHAEYAVEKGIIPARALDLNGLDGRMNAWGLYNAFTYDITHQSRSNPINKVNQLNRVGRWMKRVFIDKRENIYDTDSDTDSSQGNTISSTEVH